MWVILNPKYSNAVLDIILFCIWETQPHAEVGLCRPKMIYIVKQKNKAEPCLCCQRFSPPVIILFFVKSLRREEIWALWMFPPLKRLTD